MVGENNHSAPHEPSHRAQPVTTPTQMFRGRKITSVAGTKSAVARAIHHDGDSLSWYPFIRLLHHVYPGTVKETVRPDVLVTGTVPQYARPGDAGCDLVSGESVVLAPGQRALVSTGIAIALPEGYVGLVMPRSGLAAKHGIGLVNSPGVIDAGYRGEIMVVVLNTDSSHEFSIEKGDRIAQLVISPVSKARFHSVQTLPGSDRGSSGFGSTGTRS